MIAIPPLFKYGGLLFKDGGLAVQIWSPISRTLPYSGFPDSLLAPLGRESEKPLKPDKALNQRRSRCCFFASFFGGLSERRGKA
jgi:hypothetical protein